MGREPSPQGNSDGAETSPCCPAGIRSEGKWVPYAGSSRAVQGGRLIRMVTTGGVAGRHEGRGKEEQAECQLCMQIMEENPGALVGAGLEVGAGGGQNRRADAGYLGTQEQAPGGSYKLGEQHEAPQGGREAGPVQEPQEG